MQRLVIIRHARSAWANGSDKDRPLDELGRAQTAAMRETLLALRLERPRILCSSARRTQETWDRMGTFPDIAPHIRDDLYMASFEAYASAISEAEGDTILVGHNPTCAECLQRWSDAEPKVPAGSIAVYERSDPPRLIQFTPPN